MMKLNQQKQKTNKIFQIIKKGSPYKKSSSQHHQNEVFRHYESKQRKKLDDKSYTQDKAKIDSKNPMIKKRVTFLEDLQTNKSEYQTVNLFSSQNISEKLIKQKIKQRTDQNQVKKSLEQVRRKVDVIVDGFLSKRQNKKQFNPISINYLNPQSLRIDNNAKIQSGKYKLSHQNTIKVYRHLQHQNKPKNSATKIHGIRETDQSFIKNESFALQGRQNRSDFGIYRNQSQINIKKSLPTRPKRTMSEGHLHRSIKNQVVKEENQTAMSTIKSENLKKDRNHLGLHNRSRSDRVDLFKSHLFDKKRSSFNLENYRTQRISRHNLDIQIFKHKIFGQIKDRNR